MNKTRLKTIMCDYNFFQMLKNTREWGTKPLDEYKQKTYMRIRSPFTLLSCKGIEGEGSPFIVHFNPIQTDITRYTFPHLVCLRSIPTATNICANPAGFAPRIAEGFFFFNFWKISAAESNSHSSPFSAGR